MFCHLQNRLTIITRTFSSVTYLFMNKIGQESLHFSLMINATIKMPFVMSLLILNMWFAMVYRIFCPYNVITHVSFLAILSLLIHLLPFDMIYLSCLFVSLVETSIDLFICHSSAICCITIDSLGLFSESLLFFKLSYALA